MMTVNAERTMLKSSIVLSAFTVIMVAVIFHADARKAALCFAAANISGTVLLGVLVKRDIPWIEFGWKHARWSEIKRMSGPAFSFMGFPLGNALNLQGSTMAINYALGPLDVVIFSTARTVSRVALQMITMVNNTVWPELSLAHGANNTELIRTLHRRACQVALGFSVFVVGIMMLFGPWFLHRWTHGKVPPSYGLLAILLLVVVVYSLWSTSATLHQATNRHQRLAAWYLAATAVTVVLTYLCAKYFGLYAAAASLLLSEVVMNFYVLPESLRMAHDTWGGFLGSLLHMPDSLRPAALYGMVRRRLSR
jgi:O-antigen/teichoic acid export membrane protein